MLRISTEPITRREMKSELAWAIALGILAIALGIIALIVPFFANFLYYSQLSCRVT